MSGPPGLAERIYRLVLRAYPTEYIETFGDEMQDTFLLGLKEAGDRGDVVLFVLRELRDIPKVLASAYWHGWKRKLQNSIQILHELTSSSDLPPALPDGRESWQQVLWELSLFLIAGLLLIAATYLHFDGLPASWQRSIEFMGSIILPLTAPFLLIGLARGLPRWTYPFGGLLFGYYGLAAQQTSLWLFLLVMLFAASILALAAILTDPQPSHPPIQIRRIGQSLSLDWTRLSFGIFGAMPLIILMAFDDAHTDSRTPYFAFSVFVMIVSALIYCRSRGSTMQIAILLTGLTFSIWGAWMDKVSFTGGLMNWTTVTAYGIESLAWIASLWIQWAFFILFPAVFILFNKALHLKRAV